MVLELPAGGAGASRASARLRLLLTVLVAAGCLAPVAPASAKLQIGLSEQSPGVFADPLFAPLKMHYGRIVVPWNIGRRHDYWPGILDAWLAGAARDHVQPHVAFGEPSYSDKLIGRGPTHAQYWLAFAAFRKRWPQVRVFTPWNEETFYRAPTYRNPGLAAWYYRIVRRQCPTCTVVAADLLDLPNLTSWLRGFLRHVGHARPRLWGVHNYRDANRMRTLDASWTLKLARMVKGRIWVTESGGIDGLEDHAGRVTWPYSPSRASAAMRHLFHLITARRVRRRYGRVYVYNFYGSWDRRRHTNHWDSGLVGLDGRPRPAYWELRHLVAANR